MTSASARALLDRVERRLSHRPVREVAMFGSVAVMLDDAMLVAVDADGDLLVRVHVDDDPELLARTGAERAEMGRGRSMGVGWIRVDADAVAEDRALDDWIVAALARTDRP